MTKLFRLITILLLVGKQNFVLTGNNKVTSQSLGSIQCFLIKFEENSDPKKYSYAQYNSRFILPDFSMTICLRLEFYENISLVSI